MRREAMVLGHPLFTFPVSARLKVQSIGSGAKFSCQAETIRGWDLSIEIGPHQKPGYNPLSLLEIWIDDEASGQKIYGFAKFVQAIGKSRMLIRIVEIDGQNRELLQEIIEKRDPISLHDAS
ncbi:MAG: hypothetical protein H7318_09555 [Oligoflexus sp.]|nr:hypothetical protein [Oligoflexus sp.]